MTHEWHIVCHHFCRATHPEQGLFGFADLDIGGGLVLREVRIGTKSGRVRATFPQRAIIKGGKVATFPNGETRTISPVIIFDEADRDRFTQAALAAIERAYPGQLGLSPAACAA